MAWPTTTTSDFLSGEGAELLGQNIWDRLLEVTHKRTSWVFPDTNTTTTLQDESIKIVYIPEWALTNAVIKLGFTAERDAAVSGSATWRLREVDGPTNGSSVSADPGTSWSHQEVTLTVPNDTWAGTLKQLALQAQRPASGGDSDWQVSGMEQGANLTFESAE